MICLKYLQKYLLYLSSWCLKSRNQLKTRDWSWRVILPTANKSTQNSKCGCGWCESGLIKKWLKHLKLKSKPVCPQTGLARTVWGLEAAGLGSNLSIHCAYGEGQQHWEGGMNLQRERTSDRRGRRPAPMGSSFHLLLPTVSHSPDREMPLGTWWGHPACLFRSRKLRAVVTSTERDMSDEKNKL